MHEHIFKAKRLNNNEWVQGTLFEYIAGQYGIMQIRCMTRINPVDEDGYYNIYDVFCPKVNPNTICEFTGVNDKNDKMIFEHDIIKFINWKGNFEQKEVIYDSEWNRFCVWVNGGSYGVNKHLSDDIEVIENVYE